MLSNLGACSPALFAVNFCLSFLAMVSALDDAVGSVLSALEEKNMLANSIIVFSTDNGGPAAGFNANCASNQPLR